MHVPIIQCLHYKAQESKTINLQFISDTPVTLNQSQGQQTYHDNVKTEEGYNHAKFERSCFNGVQDKASLNFFFQWGNMSIISLAYVQSSKKLIHS